MSATNITVTSGTGSSTYEVVVGETSSTYEVISGIGSTDISVSYGDRGPAGPMGIPGPGGVARNVEIYVKAGMAVSAGAAVYISGASGANKIISLAQANTDSLSSKTLGLALQSLSNNQFGYVVTEGDLSGLSINLGAGHGVVEGDPIWLSPTIPGGLVFGLANKPSAPNHLVFLGIVTRINGNTLKDIFVKVQNGFELEELHNVAISSLSDGQVLTYDLATDLWKNKNPQVENSVWFDGNPEPVSQNVVALQIQASGDVTEGEPIPNDITVTITFAGTGGPCSYSLVLTAGTVFNSTTIAASLASGLYDAIQVLPAGQGNGVYSYDNFVAINNGAGNFADLSGITLTCNYGTASAPANLDAGGVIQYCTFIPLALGQFVISGYYGTRQWECSSVSPIIWTEISGFVSTSTSTNLGGIIYGVDGTLASSPVYSTVTSASSALGRNVVFFNSTTSQAQVTDIYDADADAYITTIEAVGAVVSKDQQNAITQFILDGKSTGWWSSIKRLYLPIWGSATPNAVDMVGLTSGTFIGSVTHALGYVQGDGATGYFSSGYLPSSLGMTTSGGCCFALINQSDSRADTRMFIGQNDASNRRVYLNQTGGLTVTTTLYGAGASPTNSSAVRTGVFLGVVNATNDRYLKRISGSGIAFTTTVTTNDTTAPSTTRTIYVMANNNNGTTANYSDARLGVYGFGLGMSSINGDKFSISVKKLWETCTGFSIP